MRRRATLPRRGCGTHRTRPIAFPEIMILGAPGPTGAARHGPALDHLGTDDIEYRHGVPTVRAPVVVVQLALAGAGFLAERVANNMIKRKVASPRAILEALDRAGRRRKGVADLAAFCRRALEVEGHDDSPAARDLGVMLVRAGVPPFVTQHPVSVDGHDYFLDFAWPDQMVGLEYNGWEDHGARADKLRQRRHAPQSPRSRGLAGTRRDVRRDCRPSRPLGLSSR